MPDAFYYLAEVLSRFDLVAVQEVRRSLDALETLMRHLGWQWRYLVTDTTEGDPGNDERLAFIYDSRKVRFSGLAGELVLPDLEDEDGQVVPARQIVRTPFTAGFQAGWVPLQLATVHILYGESKAEDPERTREIHDLATFLAKRAAEEDSASPNLVLLGDFNIFDRSDSTMAALTDAGWTVPEPLQSLPGSNVKKDRFYDQIAVLPRAHRFQPAGPASVFDYYKSVFRDEDRELYIPDMGDAYETTSKGKPRDEDGKASYYKTYWRTYQMPDHPPMWMDIKIDYSSECLAGLAPRPPQLDPQDLT